MYMIRSAGSLSSIKMYSGFLKAVLDWARLVLWDRTRTTAEHNLAASAVQGDVATEQYWAVQYTVVLR